MFRPRERIKSQADFNRVGMRGFNWNGKLVRVQWLRNAHVKDVACTRIGIKTPKKQIKLAVHRNLVKRRVRDIFRKNKAEWPEKCDFVVYCGAAAKEGTRTRREDARRRVGRRNRRNVRARRECDVRPDAGRPRELPQVVSVAPVWVVPPEYEQVTPQHDSRVAGARRRHRRVRVGVERPDPALVQPRPLLLRHFVLPNVVQRARGGQAAEKHGGIGVHAGLKAGRDGCGQRVPKKETVACSFRDDAERSERGCWGAYPGCKRTSDWPERWLGWVPNRPSTSDVALELTST